MDLEYPSIPILGHPQTSAWKHPSPAWIYDLGANMVMLIGLWINTMLKPQAHVSWWCHGDVMVMLYHLFHLVPPCWSCIDHPLTTTIHHLSRWNTSLIHHPFRFHISFIAGWLDVTGVGIGLRKSSNSSAPARVICSSSHQTHGYTEGIYNLHSLHIQQHVSYLINITFVFFNGSV